MKLFIFAVLAALALASVPASADGFHFGFRVEAPVYVAPAPVYVTPYEVYPDYSGADNYYRHYRGRPEYRAPWQYGGERRGRHHGEHRGGRRD